jgi:hypothetical protein
MAVGAVKLMIQSQTYSSLSCIQELHTLKVSGQETVTQIKAHVASLEGTATEDHIMPLAGTTLGVRPPSASVGWKSKWPAICLETKSMGPWPLPEK